MKKYNIFGNKIKEIDLGKLAHDKKWSMSDNDYSNRIINPYAAGFPSELLNEILKLNWDQSVNYCRGSKILFENTIYELKLVRDPYNMSQSLQFVPVDTDK